MEKIARLINEIGIYQKGRCTKKVWRPFWCMRVKSRKFLGRRYGTIYYDSDFGADEQYVYGVIAFEGESFGAMLEQGLKESMEMFGMDDSD